MSAPCVSVIVAAFNAEATIQETLESVLAQSVRDLEIVVVDDGSFDDTASIVNATAERDPRVRCIRQANAGQAAARNTGIVHSSGEFVSIIDADDLWLPNKLEVQLRYSKQSGAISLCEIQRFCIEGGRRIDLSRTQLPNEQPNPKYYKSVLWLRNDQMVLFNTALIPRYCLDVIGTWDPDLRTAEDWELWLRAARLASIRHIHEPLFLYRKHAGSITRQSKLDQVLASHLRILDREFAAEAIGRREYNAVRLAKIQEFVRILSYRGSLREAIVLLLRAASIPGFYFSKETFSILAEVGGRAVRGVPNET